MISKGWIENSEFESFSIWELKEGMICLSWVYNVEKFTLHLLNALLENEIICELH